MKTCVLVGTIAALLWLCGGSAAAAAPEWAPCPPSLGADPRQECASLTVPLDYANPSGATIEIAISRMLTASQGTRRGVLLYNPGGPGSPGINGPTRLAARLPSSVLERYDLVGFDPRGINFSAPVSCSLATADLNPLKFIPYPAFDLDISANVGYARRAAAGCAATSGDLLPHITTANTARDMDGIRAALGEQRISFIGYSYGSYLGAVYAQLFPSRTDRFVLDSVVHPRKIWRETFSSWGYAVELAYTGFTQFASERHETYGLGATPRAVYKKTLELITEVEAEPFQIPNSNTVLTGDALRERIRNNGLRNDQAFPGLADLLMAIDARQPTAAALAADFPTPTLDNQFAAPWAVVCGDADWPESPQTYQRDVRLYDRLFPIHGRAAANIWPCAFWAFEPRERPVAIDDLEGSGRALLVQSVRDPATPYDGGVAMRLALGSRSRLVSVETGGHVIAFTSRNDCADAHTTTFLVDGVLPRDTFCERDAVAAARQDEEPVADGLIPLG